MTAREAKLVQCINDLMRIMFHHDRELNVIGIKWVLSDEEDAIMLDAMRTCDMMRDNDRDKFSRN